MPDIGLEKRPGYRRALIGALIIAAGLFGGVYLLSAPAVPIALVPATTVRATTVPVAVAAAAVAPSFDVVRVGPRGEAVIAGRAEPGTDVIVRDGEQEIARGRADRQGTFVAVPEQPLASGGRSLTLAARGAASAEVRSDGAVVVIVPPRPVAAAPARDVSGEAEGAVAVLVPSAAPPRVLQGERGTAPVGLDSVDYDDKGAIRFTGRAAAGSTVRVYVDNQVVGDAAVEGGRWSLVPQAEMTAGVHTLRLDRLDGAGRVQARVELPFQRSAVAAAELTGGRIVVQPGQNLWRMARSAYGSGVRYTVIYLANREQIRDPRLIYPGQAISVPVTGR